MRKFKSLYVILFAGLFISSCASELELNDPQSLSVDQALATLANMQTALNGAYDELQDVDYYGREYLVVPEITANLVYLSINNSNRFTQEYQYLFDPTVGQHIPFWSDAYQAILRVNNVLDRIDGVEGDQAAKDEIRGQALAIRGMVYFDLLRYFAKPFTQSNPGTDLGVPYVTTFAIELPARNTIAECYTNILADLNQARTLVQDNGIHRFGPDAVDALLARVYLYQGDWTNAAAKASAVVGDGTKYPLVANFADMWLAPGSSEEIFTLRFTNAETRGSDNIGGIYQFPVYGDIRVAQDLIGLYEAGDQRLDVIFQDPDRGNESFQRKFEGQDGIFGLHSPKLFRAAEMHLIIAEAALNGAPGDALAQINAIRAARGASALTSATIDDLYAERQRELAFEGHTSFDYWRTGRDMVRVECNTGIQLNAPCSIPAGDFRTVFPIPQVERDVNPNAAQNPGWPE